MGELYPCHKKTDKKSGETTGNRYKIEFLMSRTQKLKGLSAASLRLKTLNDNPYFSERREAKNAHFIRNPMLSSAHIIFFMAQGSEKIPSRSLTCPC